MKANQEGLCLTQSRDFSLRMSSSCQPWRAPNAKDFLDITYPFPVVDHLEAAKQARQKVWAVRGASAYRQQGQSIQQRHGSRKSGIPMRGRGKPSKRRDTDQLSLKL